MSKARELSQRAGVDGALSNRNLIINGAMQVAQRGTSFTINSNQYTLDRWKNYQGANPASLTVSQETFAYNDGMVAEGFLNYMKVAVSTGTGTFDSTTRMIRQKVEHPHRVAGKTLTYSFWIKSNSAASGNRYYVDMFLNTGSSQITYFDDASLSGTVSTEWARKTHTFTLPDATSAFTDSGYLEIMINPINDTAGDEYYITGVQLEVGDTATPFEHRSYGQELALCQRYYWSNKFSVSGFRLFGGGVGTSASEVNTSIYLPVPLRAAPTTYSSAMEIRQGTTQIGISALTAANWAENSNHIRLYITTTGTVTAGYTNHLRTTGAGGLSLDAEL